MSHPAEGYALEHQVFSNLNEDFIITEENALKAFLKGISVGSWPNKPANTSVGVWFTEPDTQITTQTYPYMTLDLLDVVQNSERTVMGTVLYTTDQDGVAYPDTWKRRSAYPIPWDLYYQVTSYTRHPYHDRGLIAQMLRYRTPGKFGSLPVMTDGTNRRIEMVGFTKIDKVEDKKKLFSNVFTLRISTETELPVFNDEPTPPVDEVFVDIDYKADEPDNE